jgi:hypothetical protein
VTRSRRFLVAAVRKWNYGTDGILDAVLLPQIINIQQVRLRSNCKVKSRRTFILSYARALPPHTAGTPGRASLFEGVSSSSPSVPSRVGSHLLASKQEFHTTEVGTQTNTDNGKRGVASQGWHSGIRTQPMNHRYRTWRQASVFRDDHVDVLGRRDIVQHLKVVQVLRGLNPLQYV